MGSCLSCLSSPSQSPSPLPNWSETIKNAGENTPNWTCKGSTEYVKVIKVVDGDTIDIARMMGENIFQFRVRLYGIDTPEKRPPLSQVNRLEEIAASKVSSDALKRLLEKVNWLVRIDFVGEDKYGRLLGNIYIYEENGDRNKDEWLDVNNWMIINNYAKPYFGGTKKAFDTSI